MDLSVMFRHVQLQMRARLAAGELFGRPTGCGAVTERHCLEGFEQ